jgi:hypothetical protein
MPSETAKVEQRGFPREDCECECHDLGDNCYSCFVAHTNYDEWKKAREKP